MNKLIEDLINQFSKLPRIGRKAAQKIVIHLLQEKKTHALIESLNSAEKNIKRCVICGALTTNTICEYCTDDTRNNGQLCIIRDFNDLIFIEKTKIFNGKYHILGNCLSGINGKTPSDLNISTLKDRIINDKISEIIFVLPNTIEGKTTTLFIKSFLKDLNVKFSELASGIPVGGDLDYIDDGTLTIAFDERKQI